MKLRNQVFIAVLSRFPGSNEARLAAQRLQDLGVDAPEQTD